MFVYIKGEDDHFCFERCNTRKNAEMWLEKELELYSIIYDNPKCKIMSDKEFLEKFPEYKETKSLRRLGRKLKQKLS